MTVRQRRNVFNGEASIPKRLKGWKSLQSQDADFKYVVLKKMKEHWPNITGLAQA